MKPFPDRQPSFDAQEAMTAASALSEGERHGQTEQCREALSKTTGHKDAELTESGSSAIFLVLSALGEGIMVPDRGIWKGTIEHCENLGLPISFLRTDLGLVEPETLKTDLERHRPKAFLMTSFAGYVAEQDVKTLSRICMDYEVLLIEDASISIGDRILARGIHADVIVASARAPKLLNLPSGGFITSSNHELMDKIRRLNNAFAPDPVVCAGMAEELKHSQKVLDDLTALSKHLKANLDGAVHRKRRAPCAGILLNNPKKLARDAPKLGLMTTGGRSLITTCPRYDRFLEKGVVVELKKLDPGSVGSAEIEHLSQVLEGQGRLEKAKAPG